MSFRAVGFQRGSASRLEQNCDDDVIDIVLVAVVNRVKWANTESERNPTVERVPSGDVSSHHGKGIGPRWSRR